MRLFSICGLLLLANAAQASAPIVKLESVPEGTIPEIEASVMGNAPVALTLSLGNYMSGEPPTILSWQLALSLVPSEGATGTMTFGKAVAIEPSFLGLETFYSADGFDTSSTLIQEFDTSANGAQIGENQERGITEIELSYSSDASGTFILSLLPFDLDAIDSTSFWNEKTDTFFEPGPFGNTPAASGLIELARIHVQGVNLEGDFNGDLVVDAADYTVWRDNFGMPGYSHEEYAIWKENFGESVISGAFGHALPEPNGWFSIGLCGLITFGSSCRLRPRFSRVAG